MQGKLTADTYRVVTYRMTPRWVLYPFVVLTAVVPVGAIANGPGKLHGVGGMCVFVALVLISLAVPIALVVWNRGLGVHLSDAGIVSVGLNDVDVIRWQDVDRFVVDTYHSNATAVYAELGDGSRVALYALQGRLWRRHRVEAFRAALQSRLDDTGTRDPTATDAPSEFASVPLGWRRRVHRIEKRASQTT